MVVMGFCGGCGVVFRAGVVGSFSSGVRDEEFCSRCVYDGGCGGMMVIRILVLSYWWGF